MNSQYFILKGSLNVSYIKHLLSNNIVLDMPKNARLFYDGPQTNALLQVASLDLYKHDRAEDGKSQWFVISCTTTEKRTKTKLVSITNNSHFISGYSKRNVIFNKS
jgi:hypothetical protein